MSNPPTLTTLPIDSVLSSALLTAVTPASNVTTASIVVTGWISEPSTRGTWSLLYSCFFTIGLCIWTAIHPDIPSFQHSQRHAFFCKLAWVGIAFAVPELVLCVASSQLIRAWNLRQRLRKVMQSHVLATSASHDGKSPANTTGKAKAEPANAVELGRSAKSKAGYPMTRSPAGNKEKPANRCEKKFGHDAHQGRPSMQDIEEEIKVTVSSKWQLRTR